MAIERFPQEKLSRGELDALAETARLCRGDIIKMTTIAGSGHPGGSLSTLDLFLVTAKYARLDPANPRWENRDRLVLSHGHISPGAYAALGRLGFYNPEWPVATFRAFGSPFEGHVERQVPGIEWGSGNLGQGLSAACGKAISARLRGVDTCFYCFMGDGEQQKGQISEARRFAAKFKLGNLVAFVDWNKLQLSGTLDAIMPQNIAEEWRAGGWEVIEVDGHDHQEIYGAVRRALSNKDQPTCILAHTVMSKGISFIENDFNYHGKALTSAELDKALAELGLPNDVDKLVAMRRKMVESAKSCSVAPSPPVLHVQPGTARDYSEKSDCRGAFGKALADIATANPKLPMAVFDCDLVGSVRTGDFQKVRPEGFIQAGIQEHHTAACAGACSVDPVLTWWADFAVFSTDETYNQHRLSDINHAQLKTVCTHAGLDVGEDGKTHQCIDYVGTFANLFGYKVLVPADANQTDRLVRWMAQEPGSQVLAFGRSKIPVVMGMDGKPAFAGGWKPEYGKATQLRGGEGATAAIIVMGQLTIEATMAADQLREAGMVVEVWNTCTPLAIDRAALRSAASTGVIVTVEDHHVRTGLAAQVARALVEEGLAVGKFKALGVDGYACSGDVPSLYKAASLDAEGIAITVKELVR